MGSVTRCLTVRSGGEIVRMESEEVSWNGIECLPIEGGVSSWEGGEASMSGEFCSDSEEVVSLLLGGGDMRIESMVLWMEGGDL